MLRTPGLHTSNCMAYRQVSSAEVLGALASLTRLTYLDLDMLGRDTIVWQSDDVLALGSTLNSLRLLAHLRLTDIKMATGLRSGLARYLAHLPRLVSLSTDDDEYTQVQDCDAMRVISTHVPQLTALTWRAGQDERGELLSDSLSRMTALVQLDLEVMHACDGVGARSLFVSELTRLQFLTVQHAGRYLHERHLSRLQLLTRLDLLSYRLEETQVSLLAFQRFAAALCGLATLKHLELHEMVDELEEARVLEAELPRLSGAAGPRPRRQCCLGWSGPACHQAARADSIDARRDYAGHERRLRPGACAGGRSQACAILSLFEGVVGSCGGLPVLAPHLACLTQLTHLALSGARLGDGDVAVLGSAIACMPELAVLCVARNKVGVRGIAALGSCLTGLLKAAQARCRTQCVRRRRSDGAVAPI